jgi:hypothetical protein
MLGLICYITPVSRILAALLFCAVTFGLLNLVTYLSLGNPFNLLILLNLKESKENLQLYTVADFYFYVEQ